MIEIMFFASLAEKIGERVIYHRNGEGWSIEQLTTWLADLYPEAKGEISQSLIAVNEAYVKNHYILHDDDQVAFIPPISGG